MKARLTFPILFVAALFLASCYTVPETHRSAYNFIGQGQETRLGISAFDEVKKKEHASTNAEQTAMVERVGRRIAAVAGKDIPNAQWEFVLFESKEANAFALPGGKVGVYTGILEITKDETGLATVLGHEIAHVAARHSAERMSEQLTYSGIAAGLSIGLAAHDSRIGEAASIAFGIGVPLALIMPHTRAQESEADHIGLIYMAKAGYNPEEAVAFWQRFRDYNQKRGGSTPPFLSTHPADEKRIQDLKALLPDARVYYQTSGH